MKAMNIAMARNSRASNALVSLALGARAEELAAQPEKPGEEGQGDESESERQRCLDEEATGKAPRRG
jgi:hypothetical protein